MRLGSATATSGRGGAFHLASWGRAALTWGTLLWAGGSPPEAWGYPHASLCGQAPGLIECPIPPHPTPVAAVEPSHPATWERARGGGDSPQHGVSPSRRIPCAHMPSYTGVGPVWGNAPHLPHEAVAEPSQASHAGEEEVLFGIGLPLGQGSPRLGQGKPPEV